MSAQGDAGGTVDAQRRPRIGITTSGSNKKPKYVAAVERAGGVAELVRPGAATAAELFERFDGFVLTGGADVDPKHYGGKNHPAVYGIDAVRDQFEFELARGIVARKTPALCICRGMQLLNVALGGSLIEHLPDELGTSVKHSSRENEYPPHEVSIDPSSRLAVLLDTLRPSPPSSHHQVVRKLGKDLRMVASASDGAIEAVEHATHVGLIAVQWHPEQSVERNQQRLFEELIRLARE